MSTSKNLLRHAASALRRGTNSEHDGMRGATALPNPALLCVLCQQSQRSGLPEGAAAPHLHLRRMSPGGVCGPPAAHAVALGVALRRSTQPT